MKIRRQTRKNQNYNLRTMAPVKQKKTRKNVPKNQSGQLCCCYLSKGTPDVHFPLVWSELRHNMQLCDGVVKCEDKKEFKVHRAILSVVSPFFKALFLNTINRGQPEVTEVYVKVPSKIFSLILDYAYCGSCEITCENVQYLLTYADQLEVLGVVRLCSNFMIRHLDLRNCLGMILFARWYFCRELEERGKMYVRHHFTQIMAKNPDFYKIPVEELCAVLSDDELNAKSEEIVFDAIKMWIEHEPDKRKTHLPRLLTCVRLGLLACNYYTSSVLKWKYMHNEDCQNVLQKATAYLAQIPTDENVTESMENITRPRIPYEILFAIGGWSAGSPTNFMETYDARANRWLLCKELDDSPRAYHGMCTLHELIYMIGGFDGNDYFNTVRSFNPVKRIWREHACMYYPRCYVSVTMHDGKIYAMGGYNGRSRMSSAERYDPNTNQWELIASMHVQRSDASAATLQDKIYIAGGFNGTEVLRSAEVYDPVMNQWTTLPAMFEARSGVSILAFSGHLYALGGFNGYSRLKTGERYSPVTTKWTEIREMLYPRSNFVSVMLDQMIYVVGGFNGRTTISNVECYDSGQDIWDEVASMNLNRSALSACVLSGLSNAKEYSFAYCQSQSLGMPDA